MKLFFRYLNQRRRLYGTAGLFFGIFFLSFLLYRLPLEAVMYPTLLCMTLGLLLSIGDFLQVKQRHDAFSRIQSLSDVTAEALPEARGIWEEDYRQILLLLRQEHRRFQEEAAAAYSDMVDYYTVWAHQIKTPIASMQLSLQGEDSPLSRKLSAELNRVEQYVEMVLVFLRLGSESTDYVIREHDVDSIVRAAVKKFSQEFIGRKLRLSYQPFTASVITDEKWLSFVVEQVLSNALKYTRSGSISIWMEDRKLYIRDTGMGIASSDLPRIFEKGYTGLSGRTNRQSSGLGLYLCRRICTNLGHRIWAESAVGEGTTVTIDLARERVQPE